jgi:hypothetical protein
MAIKKETVAEISKKSSSGNAKPAVMVPKKALLKKDVAKKPAKKRVPIKPKEAKESVKIGRTSAPKARKAVEVKKIPAKRAEPKPITIDEVQAFITQHNEGKAIDLPGRTANTIARIHEAYNQVSFKDADSVFRLLSKQK